jgi:hypothetical protein
LEIRLVFLLQKCSGRKKGSKRKLGGMGDWKKRRKR